jgi:hypothetical protein
MKQFMGLEKEQIPEHLVGMSLQIGKLYRNVVNENRVYNQMELESFLDQLWSAEQ